MATKPEYTDGISYLAWSQAKYYPGTSAAAWEAYLHGNAARPVAWGTALTRPQRTTVTRTYHGVLVTETADGWQAENVVSVCEVNVVAPKLQVVKAEKKQRRAA